MRRIPAALAFFAPVQVLAHVPGDGADLLASLGHQLTSLHHVPGTLILAALATFAVLVLRRSRSGR